MADGGRAAAAQWARLDLRRRWFSLVLLGVLAGVTAGFAMAAFAGARRTDTALGRLRRATNGADAVVFSGQVGAFHPDWDKLRAQSEIADVAVWELLFGSIANEQGQVLFASHDGTFMGTVSKGEVVQGRLWNPDASDEVVVDETAAKAKPLGSSFVFQPFGATQDDLSGEPPNGPPITLHVVGVVRDLSEFLFVAEGRIVAPPGVLARYGDQVEHIENADVRLRGGAADIASLQRDASALIAPGTPVLDLHAVARRVDTTLSVERAALVLLAGAIAVAGGLLVAQALGRSATFIDDDAVVLRAVGMTRADLAAAVGLSHLVPTAVAAMIAFSIAVAASQLFPVGLARAVDPDVGVHIDWTVLAPGTALTLLLVAGGAASLARRGTRLRVASGQDRPSGVTAAVRRWAPLTIGLGTTMAFDRGRRRSSVSARPALVAATIGVLGIVGTLTIDSGISDALAHPERAGVTWDASLDPMTSDYRVRNLDPELLSQVKSSAPAGSKVVELDRVVIDVSRVGVPTFALRPPADESIAAVQLGLTAGRAPLAAGEAAIGPATAAALHASIGDTIQVGDDQTPVRIVGLALFPNDVHAEFDEGLWLTPAQFDQVTPPTNLTNPNAGGPARAVLVRFPSGVHRSDGIGALRDRMGGSANSISPPQVPVELTNLRNVRTLPIYLAGFLALVAVAALSYVLAASARHRRRDFAVLRTFGLTRRGTRMVLNAQSTAIGLVGLVIGLPAGLVVGRRTWQWVSHRVPLENVPPFALFAVLLIGPLTVVVVNALAIWPGHRVGRLQPAVELRTE